MKTTFSTPILQGKGTLNIQYRCQNLGFPKTTIKNLIMFLGPAWNEIIAIHI